MAHPWFEHGDENNNIFNYLLYLFQKCISISAYIYVHMWHKTHIYSTMHLLFVNLLNFSKKSWWIFMLSCWFLNGSKMSYICCAPIWVKIIYIFVVLFCACWSIFAPLCSFPLPSSSIPISPYLCLYLWLPFQAAWKSCWYACAEPSTSTTAPFSSMGSLPRLTSSKHLVRIRWECRCASSKAFRYHESF